MLFFTKELEFYLLVFTISTAFRSPNKLSPFCQQTLTRGWRELTTEQHDSDLKFSVIFLHLVVMSDERFCVNEQHTLSYLGLRITTQVEPTTKE